MSPDPASAALVVDCSALVDALLGSNGDDLEDQIGDSILHVPELIDYEFLSALRRHVNTGRLRASAATEALHSFGELKIERHGAELMRSRIWAMRHTLTAYDSSYVALAEALNLPLLTSDLRLAKAAEAYCEVKTA